MKLAKSFVCSPLEPAGNALRRILLLLAEVVETNWPLIIEDRDPEPLHDLRVATRRTRTALGELKGVFSKKPVRPFRRDFKWLAGITGPCRDYDVWIADLGVDLQTLTRSSDREGRILMRAATDQRQLAWLELKEHLLLPRFQGLVPAWKTELRSPSTISSKHGRRRVGDLAGERINRAHGRLHRRRAEVLSGATDTVLHTTRIEAKKLRYLLEFFKDLYDDAEVNALIQSLKRLQDDLGRFNDCVVQRQLLSSIASGFEDLGRPSNRSVLTLIACLDTHIEARQNHCRASIQNHFSAFTSRTQNQRFRAMVKRPAAAVKGDPAAP